VASISRVINSCPTPRPCQSTYCNGKRCAPPIWIGGIACDAQRHAVVLCHQRHLTTIVQKCDRRAARACFKSSIGVKILRRTSLGSAPAGSTSGSRGPARLAYCRALCRCFQVFCRASVSLSEMGKPTGKRLLRFERRTRDRSKREPVPHRVAAGGFFFGARPASCFPQRGQSTGTCPHSLCSQLRPRSDVCRIAGRHCES